MTEQDFVPSHFVEVNQDVVEPGTSGEDASTPEASDSPSTSGVGTAGHLSLKQMLAHQSVPWIKHIKGQSNLPLQGIHSVRIH